jgi:hypothetical protein
MTRHTWQLSGPVPPPAWAALVADARVLIAVARQRGITVAGPAGTGQPVLDTERIALAVRTTAAASFSAPFVFSRTLPEGSLDTVDSGLYDSIVLAALNRARRYFGALFTMSTEATPRTVAQASRLGGLVFGADDRRLDGAPEPDARDQVEDLVRSHLDDLQSQAPAPSGVTGYLAMLIPALQAELDGRVAAETPAA